ncbi:hypothetical protein ACFSTA_01385 [Ornithinibacillus salinisoli]|uniref:Uncharacterized protein n=1 Tax=Ornithinibacillus salinisoli TaxID=1848459 RepID=A0ABW4VWR8_9BACI
MENAIFIMFCRSWVGEELLFYGELDELFTLINNKEIASFRTYCWSEDRTWRMNLDFDLDFTLLGEPKKLVDQLAQWNDIEMFKIENSTSLRILKIEYVTYINLEVYR